MEYRNRKPSTQDSLPSYREDSVMDAGSMESVIPLKIAQRNGFKITNPKRNISLENASGVDMKIQGVAAVWARAKGAKTYNKIIFFILSEVQEVLISFKHQAALRILSARYPCYLGEEGRGVDGSTEERDTVIPHGEEAGIARSECLSGREVTHDMTIRKPRVSRRTQHHL